MKASSTLLAVLLTAMSVSCGNGHIDDTNSTSVCNNLPEAVSFLSFFPCLSGSAEECDVFAHPAAVLAAEHINSNQNILKFPELGFNTTLRLIEIGTMGDTAQASFALADYLHDNPPDTIQGIIGPSSSSITEIIAYITGINNELHEISYGATDPSLSDQKRYPLLYSTIPSEKFLNVGRLALLTMFGWFRCGVIASTERLYARAAEHFGNLSQRHPHLNIAYYGSFDLNPNFAFNEMFTSDLRIIVGLFGETNARSVLCQASKFRDGRLTDFKHVWILPSYYNPDWWKLNESEIERLPDNERCSNQKMEAILNSVLFLGSFNYHPAEPTTSQLTLKQFYEQLLDKTCELFPHSFDRDTLVPFLPLSNAPTAYDAVWSLALAWNEAIPELLSNATVCLRKEMRSITREILSDSLMKGYHNFNLSQDAYGQILVSQFIDGQRRPIGIYEANTENNFVGVEKLQLSEFKCLNASDMCSVYLDPLGFFMWKGPNNETPSDGVEIVLSSISVASLSVASILLLVSLAFGVALLVINIVMKDNKFIKASSPKLNLITITGLMLVMPSSILLGLSYSRYEYGISQTAANIICQMDIWFTATGFVLAFASMFAKQWRVWRIFFNRDMRKRRYVSDDQLILLSVILILPVLIILTLWWAVDPLYSTDSAITENKNVMLNITVCSSQHYIKWRCSQIGYTILVICGLIFIGIQSQNVTSRFKNSRVAARFAEEGNSVGRATLLSVFIFTVIFVILSFLQTDIKLYVPTFWINFCWSLLLPLMLLCALYIPKFFDIYKSRDERRRLQLLHEHFTRIRKEMLAQDAIQQQRRQEKGLHAGLMLHQYNIMFTAVDIDSSSCQQTKDSTETSSSSSLPHEADTNERSTVCSSGHNSDIDEEDRASSSACKSETEEECLVIENPLLVEDKTSSLTNEEN